MTIGRASRRAAAEQAVVHVFGSERSQAALDFLEPVELAWHDCYGEVAPPKDVVDDILLVSQGDLAGLIQAGRLAVEDYRDLRIAAGRVRDDR